MFRYLSLIGAFLVVLGTDVGQAKNASNSIVIDGKEYSKEDIIEDFLRVAFSDIPWNADAGEIDRKKIYDSFVTGSSYMHDKESKRVKQLNSKPIENWLKEHIHYIGKGLLYKRNVINKWDSDKITIGFGTPYAANLHVAKNNPKYIKTLHDTFERNMKNGGEKRIEDIFSLIRKSIPMLSKAIGKPIELIHPRDVWDNTSEFARIRIIPTEHFSYRSWLKSGHEPLPDLYEERFLNGILFQSYTRRYFDGYLLPVSSHELDIAICKINPRLDSVFYDAILSECLVRSLGLPGISNFNASVLSHWHSDTEKLLNYSPWFKIGDRFVDPRNSDDAIEKKIEWLKNQGKNDAAEKAKQIHNNTKYRNLNERLVQSFHNVIPYDLFMLRLLYCPEIKPGMSKEVVGDILRNNNSCFNQY